MKNVFKSKRNILIMMFALVILMGIGFAAYSQQLKINDTSSIDSNWNVYIKSVTPGTPVGGATGNGTVDNKTTATLATDLKYPGDSIEYTIAVKNDGNIDAEIEKVELKASKENTVIKYSIIDEANIQYLNSGDEKTFKVKVEYDPIKTGTATEDQKTNSLTLTVDYVQKGTGTGTYVPGGSNDNFTGIVYSRNLLTNTDFGNETWEKENLIWPEDNIDKIKGYTEDYNTLGNNFFLKHNMTNGKIESNEVCFVRDGLYCLKSNEYEISKASLLSIFGEDKCNISDTSINCSPDRFGFGAGARADGYVEAYFYASVYEPGDTAFCYVNANGSSVCGAG